MYYVRTSFHFPFFTYFSSIHRIDMLVVYGNDTLAAPRVLRVRLGKRKIVSEKTACIFIPTKCALVHTTTTTTTTTATFSMQSTHSLLFSMNGSGTHTSCMVLNQNLFAFVFEIVIIIIVIPVCHPLHSDSLLLLLRRCRHTHTHRAFLPPAYTVIDGLVKHCRQQYRRTHTHARTIPTKW